METHDIATAQEGWLEVIKSKLYVDKFLIFIKESKENIIEFGVYLGIGFLIGFLIKRFATIFIGVVLFVAVLIALSQMDIITIDFNYIRLYEFFGIRPAMSSSDTIFTIILEGIKVNWILAVGFVFGFFLGLKLA